MKLMLDIDVKEPAQKISYGDKIFLAGSCFTEHIGGRLASNKFSIVQNPHGILFDPLSVCESLQSYIKPTIYTANDLVYFNELYQSWHHHSSFSGLQPAAVLEHINRSQREANQFLQQAKWLIITLGSSFSYQLATTGQPVANCHRAPAQWFNKHLVSTEETIAKLTVTMDQLLAMNPGLQVIFTVSPVRHIRDGVVENNRSKARLLEAVHTITNRYAQCIYFPAYEIVIDVLRDYRFYDIDLVHPNYTATEVVFEYFTRHYIHPDTAGLMEEVKKVGLAFRHKPFQPNTEAHKKFLLNSLQKTRQLQTRLPQLDFTAELQYFAAQADDFKNTASAL